METQKAGILSCFHQFIGCVDSGRRTQCVDREDASKWDSKIGQFLLECVEQVVLVLEGDFDPRRAGHVDLECEVFWLGSVVAGHGLRWIGCRCMGTAVKYRREFGRDICFESRTADDDCLSRLFPIFENVSKIPVAITTRYLVAIHFRKYYETLAYRS